jgi:hypothetical protein
MCELDLSVLGRGPMAISCKHSTGHQFITKEEVFFECIGDYTFSRRIMFPWGSDLARVHATSVSMRSVREEMKHRYNRKKQEKSSESRANWTKFAYNNIKPNILLQSL